MTIRVLHAEAAQGRSYVPGIAVGDLIFVSGQIPIRTGQLVDGPIEDQTAAVFENIAKILDEAGASLRDVVRCGVFLADLGDLPRFNAAYERAFGTWRPTRTTVGALLPGYAVEVDCIAVHPTTAEMNAPA